MPGGTSCVHPPPWPDEPGYATAIRTWRELIAESVPMRNCSGAHSPYLNSIRQEAAIFTASKNTGSVATTLYCVKQSGVWHIGEVRRWANGIVSRQHIHCLALWLAERQSIADETLCLPRPSGCDEVWAGHAEY